MTGRDAVASRRRRLNATFDRVRDIEAEPELRSDFARYLCVQVSGFLEQSVVDLVLEHVRRNSSLTVQRHIEARLGRRFANAKSQTLIDLMNTFDLAWGTDLKDFLVDEYKDAVDSVVDLRNQISHGGSVGVTMARVQSYYERVNKVVDRIAELCVS